MNGFLGGSSESALISQYCLEPGYTYYGMMDPANGLTAINAQNIDAWVHDPSVIDPIYTPPGNDILCLTMLDPLYEVVVTPAGITPPFQAVAGNNLITNTSNVPYVNPIYTQINSIGRSWIFEYTLAICKEMLGYVRGKYSTVPIPGSEVTLNQQDLLTDARAEKIALLEKGG